MVSELMSLSEDMDDQDIGEIRCHRLQENSNELDNLTVTIVTTSGVLTSACKFIFNLVLTVDHEVFNFSVQ